MDYKLKRKLKKLNKKKLIEDIKQYIKSPHEFYTLKLPEIKILAKRLHEEYKLKEFYRVFNRLWKQGYTEERSLALYTLKLYKEEFDLSTWRFLKPKFHDMKTWDEVDSIAINVIGEILLKYPSLEKEILELSKEKSIWIKRMALMSTIPLIKENNLKLPLHFITTYLYTHEEPLQKAIGILISEISKINQELAKKIILKNSNMPLLTFEEATKHLKELRKIRNIKKLKPSYKGIFFWKI